MEVQTFTTDRGPTLATPAASNLRGIMEIQVGNGKHGDNCGDKTKIEMGV
jgi:hypothetical protein